MTTSSTRAAVTAGGPVRRPTIPDTMRAAVLRRPGEGLAVETLRTPRPGPGEALLQVTACGLCHSDLHVRGGAIGFPVPAVLGHEVSGRVVELGPGAERGGLRIGEPVVAAFLMPCGSCEACARGRDDLCGPFFTFNRQRGQLFDGRTRLRTAAGEPVAMYSMGGLAQYAVVPVTALTPLLDGMDPVAAAVLGCAALTAYGAVRHGADLRAGETVAVVATGGVGMAIVQVARALGARRVIGIGVSDEKLAAARAAGATHAVNSSSRDPREAVLEITGGRGVDVAFEALGSPATWATALAVLADGGRMVAVGLGDGAQTAAVPINQLVRRSQRIVGSYGARTRTDLPAVVRLAAEGALGYRELVTRRLALDEADQGYELLAGRLVTGRAVVDMSR